MSRERFTQLLIYNNFLNGDWKRQSYYRPTPERVAEIALYEWDHDQGFNGVLNESANRVDLTGAFENSPIPTLILEGKWDLTWGEEKRAVLAGNHPGARMVVFEEAGHGVYDEDPDRFFAVLRDFIETLPDISQADLESYGESLAAWDVARQ